MSILTKTQVKNIFVTNVVPQQVDYSNWIDSCVFLNADGSVPANALLMPYTVTPLPDAGFNYLFFNSADSNNLSVQNPDGNISRVTPSQYVIKTVSSAVATPNLLFITKRPIVVLGFRTSNIGVGTYGIGASYAGADDSVTTTVQIINPLNVNSPSGTDYTLQNGTIINANIPADQIINISFGTPTGTFDGVIVMEYKEV